MNIIRTFKNARVLPEVVVLGPTNDGQTMWHVHEIPIETAKSIQRKSWSWSQFFDCRVISKKEFKKMQKEGATL